MMRDPVLAVNLDWKTQPSKRLSNRSSRLHHLVGESYSFTV